ncbi:MAG: NAD(P)H-dependent oxidoreductase [Parvularculaceae bacterium]
MSKKILVIQGHPDGSKRHYCHALADAYAEGAERAGHQVQRLNVASCDVPIIRSPEEWATPPTGDMAEAQGLIAWADHLVFIYPLWMGGMPALLRAFLEQVARGGFAIREVEGGKRWEQGLKGKSARIVVTMGMPGQVYRWFFGAHSLKAFERNILKFAGVDPVRDTVIGLVEALGDDKREKIVEEMRKLGARAE